MATRAAASTIGTDGAARGAALLRDPLRTMGSAFPREDRRALGLEGLLPWHVSTLEEQAQRAYANIARKADPLEQYVGMAALQDRNERLFHRVLADHLEELLPVVYTPTVGRACEEFSHIFRRPRGLWITPGHRGRVLDVLENARDDVRLLVATDNERILGLGDQGAGGMGIPVGKLALYTAGAGIPPWQTLPVSLDVGTDNAALLGDALYLGYRSPRLRGAEYDDLVDEFVEAVRTRWPGALLQWEDFKKANAFRLLERYRSVLPSFNDDIQGTAAVTVAALIAASRATGVPLAEQRVVILGAGAAGIGIAGLVRATLRAAGLEGEPLRAAVACLDSAGLVVDDQPIADGYKRPFAWAADTAARCGLGPGRPRDLEAVVRAVRPTVLVGTSGKPGTFGEAVVREMARHVARPVVLPMSNPTSQCEARPEDVLAWSGGRALVATGSPFPPVRLDGREVVVSQANNAFVFPGVGLGALVSGARAVSDTMFLAAAKALSDEVGHDRLAAGGLFPRVADLRAVSVRVACAVASEAASSGLGRPRFGGRLEQDVADAMWEPGYGFDAGEQAPEGRPRG